MNYVITNLSTNAVVAYARTIEEALLLAYGDDTTDLDLAEMDYEDCDDADDLAPPF